MPDESVIGREFEPLSFPVEACKVREMAKALMDDDPTYRDEAAAVEAGFAGIPAPLTITSVQAHWNPDGVAAVATSIGIDIRQLLHGGTTWEYLAPVYAGDTLTARGRITDVRDRTGKRGGAMTLVTLTTEYTNQYDVLALRTQDVLIERHG